MVTAERPSTVQLVGVVVLSAAVVTALVVSCVALVQARSSGGGKSDPPATSPQPQPAPTPAPANGSTRPPLKPEVIIPTEQPTE